MTDDEHSEGSAGSTVATDVGASDSSTVSAAGRWYGRIEFAAVGSVVIAVVVSAVIAAVHGWIPVSDEALIELRVRDVPAHLPLVGVWSRFGWNHPGPGMFYYLSSFYWLGGGRSTALLVAMIVFQGACVLGAWALVRRVHPLAAIGFLVAGLVVLVTSDPWALRNPWNPYVSIGGGFLLFAAAWSFAGRRPGGAVMLLPLGSFLVQVHAVMAPMVLATGVFAIIAFLVVRDRPVPTRSIVVGCVVTLVMWIPPIVEQVMGSPGNLRLLMGSHDAGSPVGLINTLKVAFAQLAPWPGAISPGVVRQGFLPLQAWSFPVWGLVLVAAVALVIRFRNKKLGLAIFVAVGMALGAYGGVVMLSGGPYSYLAIGTRVSVVVLITLSVVVFIELLPVNMIRSVHAAGTLVAIALSVVLVVTQAMARNPLQGYEGVVEDFVDAIVADRPAHVIEVQSTPPNFHTMIMAPALVLGLEKRGYDVRSPMLGDSLIGAHRARGGADYVVRVAVPDNVDQLTVEGWKVLAVHQPFTDVELSEMDRLNIELLDHPVGDIDSITSGARPRLESEMVAIEKGRPAVAVVVMQADPGRD